MPSREVVILLVDVSSSDLQASRSVFAAPQHRFIAWQLRFQTGFCISKGLPFALHFSHARTLNLSDPHSLQHLIEFSAVIGREWSRFY